MRLLESVIASGHLMPLTGSPEAAMAALASEPDAFGPVAVARNIGALAAAVVLASHLDGDWESIDWPCRPELLMLALSLVDTPPPPWLGTVKLAKEFGLPETTLTSTRAKVVAARCREKASWYSGVFSARQGELRRGIESLLAGGAPTEALWAFWLGLRTSASACLRPVEDVELSRRD